MAHLLILKWNSFFSNEASWLTVSQAKQYLFRPAAEKDLEGIYDYTLKKFGETQANVYIRGLFDAFDRIMHSPLLARHIDMSQYYTTP